MADSDDTPDNEIMTAAKTASQAARRSATGSNPPAAEARRWPLSTVAGVAGLGIGSAALAAALIYSRSGKKKD